jgi:undecaprenyl-diphosphatase
MTLDTQVFYLLNNLAGQSSFFDGIIVFFASYLAYILIVVFLALVFFSQYAGREKLQIVVVTGVSALIARFGIAELIRFFYHRPRPFLDLPVHQLLTSNEWSFPSGHATFFFAMATVVYFYNKKWGIGFFIIAILITAGRVAAGVHYPSDIVGGALIGVIVAYITFRIARRISTPRVVENTHGSDS